MPEISDTLARLRQTLPEMRKDGTPRRTLLPKREEALAELMEALVRHIVMRDGLAEHSTSVCRGCSHERVKPCPFPVVLRALYELGRGDLEEILLR